MIAAVERDAQSSPRIRGADLVSPTLLARLHAIARRRASPADAADAVQQVLIDVWLRGAQWHEGRIVLHLKSLLRNERRARARRAQREAIYVLMLAGEDSA